MGNPFQVLYDISAATSRLAIAVENLNIALTKQGTIMSAELQVLIDKLAAHNTVEAGVLELLKTLHDQLVAAAQDPAKILEIAADVEAHTQAMADAITANTIPPPPTP